ncbi:MAG: hypothetical protein ACRCRW_02430 [Aeromonadaceae bacterium]
MLTGYRIYCSTALAALALLMAGCGQPEPAKAPQKNVLLESQTQALEKAKQVEQTLQQAASAQEAAILQQVQQ